MADKIDALFDDLQSRGFAKDKTREDFRNYMLAPGTQGYQNRKDFFDDFKGQGLTDLGTYEDFVQLIGLRGGRRNQQQSASNPAQAPSMDFAPLDTKQANRRMMGRGAVPFDQQDTESEQPDNNIRRIVNGNLTPKEQQRAQKRMQQRMDEIAYEGETGNRMRQPVKDIQFEAPAIERDEFGNVRRDENGNPLVGFTTDENAVSEHRDIMAEQAEWDSLSPDEKRRRAREAKLRAEEIDYTEPTLWDTISKKTKSSIIRKGAELVDFMQQMTSGMYVEDPSSPTGYTRTATYEEQRKNKKDPLTRMSDYLHDEADVLSRQGEPLQGRDFLDLLWDGEIGAAMQKGVGVALESLPMTLSAYNPVTMAMNGILMASGNYRQELLDNPDIPAPKRFAMAVGSAAIEQIVEKYSDPVFKYVGGSKILKGFAKEGAEEIAKDVTKKATETLAQRIFRGLGGLAKDAAGEATEEIITDFGNDALGELLDLASGDKDYGIRAQWEQMKRENPNVSLKDFAWQKAKEYINDGIAGGMAGAYTSGTTQASVKGLQFALGNKASAEDITRNPGARIDPVTMEVAQSYDDGYTETEPDLMKRYNDEAQASAADLPQYGKEFAKMVMESESPVETMDYLMQNRNYFTDEQIAAASDFYQKMSRVSGVMDGALDRIDQEVENENAKVRYNTHQQTGSVITAQVGDRPCYITGGDVVTDEATGMPVLVGTGGAVVVRDAQTGVTSVHSPQEVRVTSMTNADEMQQYNETVLRQQLMQQADEDISFGSPANEVYQLEDTVTLNDGEGNTITGEIVGMPNSIDGVYQVQTNDPNEPMKYLTADELNRRIATHNGMEVQRGQQIADEGQTIENQQLEQTETESVPTVSNQEQPQSQPSQGGEQTGSEAGAKNGTGADEQPVSALSKIPVLTDNAGKPVLNRKGKPQYQWHKASVEDAAAALIETTGGDMLMARDTASDLVKNAQAGLEKIRKQKPKGEDPIEIAESRMEIRRQEQEQQAIIKQWQDVNQAIQKQMRDEEAQRQAEIEAAKSEEQRKREAEEARINKEKQEALDRQRLREAIERDKEKRNKEYEPLVKARQEMADDQEALSILNDTEPRSLDEWVSSLIRPHSMLWQDASDREVGLQSELGLKRGDMQRMMSLLGNKDNGAKPFGKVVLDIHEGLPEGLKQQYTDADVRNTLIELFNEGSSTRMMNLTAENRIAEAREAYQQNLLREAEAELEAWAEANRLNPEEREAFEDYLAQTASEPEQEIINNIIADQEYEQSERSAREDQQPVSRTDVSGSQGSESKVQQETQAPGNGDYEAGTAQGTEATASEQAVSDAAVSGEGSVIPVPERDMPRFNAIRQNLTNAYKRLIDNGEREPKLLQDISTVAREVQNYVDEGLDDYSNKGQQYFDEVVDYEGNDPEMLADQYITRVYQDRFCDDDADQLYILHGLKPDMREEFKLLSDNGKQFEANENGVCINPNVISNRGQKRNGYDIRTALSEKGWVGAYTVDGSTYGASGPVTAGWYDDYFDTEAECQAFHAQRALDYLKRHNDAKMKKYEKALQDIIDKVPNKPVAKKASPAENPAKPKEKSFVFNEDGVCTNPNEMEIGGSKFNTLIKTAKTKDGWVGVFNNNPRLSFSYGDDLLEDSTPVFNTEEECRAYYAQQALDDLNQTFDGRDEDLLTKALQKLVSAGNKEVKPARQAAPAEKKRKPELSDFGSLKTGKRFVTPDGTIEIGRVDYDRIVVFDVDENGNRGNVTRVIDTVDLADGLKNGTIKPAEQLKPTDLRDAVRPESPELGVAEANAKARQAAGEPQPIGNGDFGPIYDQFRGKPKEAIDFLISKGNGEALGALSHKDIGEIDLVWGEEGTGHSDGYGLSKLVKYHPEVLDNLQDILDEMKVIKRTDNRINLESDKYKAAVRLTWNEKSKTWLLTLFEKKNSALDNTTDTGKTSNRGKRNDTATPQSTVSDGKDTNNSDNFQEKTKKSSQEPQNSVKRLVSDERMAELKKKLNDKLGGQLNAGVDPEILSLGIQLAVGYIERGVTKFADFAKAIIEDMGDYMRPYLKPFYNSVRDMPEASDYADQMDDYKTVKDFDVYNFDKQQTPDAFTKAQQVVNEQNVTKQVNKIKKDNPDLYAGDFFANQQESEPIGKTSSPQEIAAEEAKVDTNPSEAQKEAGNYQKGHINVDGYDITIENPKGSVRRGTDANGKPWKTEMHNTYGYIRGTEGVDGDHIDVFLSDSPASGSVFVVDQINPGTGEFDEHKVMYGFGSEEEAREAYLANYSKGWKGLGNITEVSREKFKEWIESSHRKTKPFAEYSMVKSEQANADNGQQAIMDQLGDLQDNGKQYEENKPAAYELGEKFAKTLPKGTISKEALRLASEAIDANKAKGGVYALPFFDGVTEKIKKQEQHLQSVNDEVAKHLKKYRTLAPVEVVYIDSYDDDQSLKDSKEQIAFNPETKKIIIFADNIDEDYIEEGLFHESIHRGLQQYYGDGPIELAEAFWETESPNKPEVSKRQKEAIANEYAQKPEDIKEEYFVHLLSHHMIKGSVDRILSRLSPEHQEIVNNILHNIGYDTAEETRRRATAEEANTTGTPDIPKESGDGRGINLSSPTGKIEDVGEQIAGARKDMTRKIAQTIDSATKQTLAELPFSKAYKKPDLKKAVEEGALREDDATFYDAWFATMVNPTKPKVTQSEARMKKWNPEYRTKLERWVDNTYDALQVLKQFVEASEEGRDQIIENLLANKYSNREAKLAEIEKRKEWNKGKDVEWGDKTTPNPLWVTYEVMKQLDYKPGDKLDIPYGIVEGNSSGTGYLLYNTKGERNYDFNPRELDEAISNIVYLAKLKRGDADIQHPMSMFYTQPTKSEYGETGRYRVMWGAWNNPKSKEFDNKEDAAAFAEGKKGAFVSPINEIKRRFGYKVMFQHPLNKERMAVDDQEFDTKDEANAYLDENYDTINETLNKLLEKEDSNAQAKALTPDDMVFTAMVRGKDNKYTYGVIIDKKYANNFGMPLILKEGFANRDDAKSYADSVKQSIFDTYNSYKSKMKSFTYFDTGKDSRAGEDYRGDKDVTAEDFMNTFGFRGVQFGNWTNQRDRQMAVNQAYDSFMDLAKLIGVSPKALSLNGELGIAFGARGSGNFAAHYEPGEIVINLTKTMGAGSLAHEWWHALDNYFARTSGQNMGMVTDDRNISMRPELRKAYNDLLAQIEKSNYYTRSKNKGDYWGRMHEVTARLLAEWVDQELKKRGELNTFLSRGAKTEGVMKINYERYKAHAEMAGKEVMPFDEFKKLDEAMAGSPYPSKKEVDNFSAAMRNIFDVMEERTDPETGKVALYQKVEQGGVQPQTESDNALRDALIDEIRNTGIDLVTDTEEGQKVLDEVNGKATLSKGKKRAVETASLNPKEGSPADISTADGAKIQKKLESYANKLEKVSNLRKNFLDELADNLGATSDGSKSKYATFITKSGDKVTIRLGNHNATVSSFDYKNENNGISIVVSKRENEGIKNNGNAHIVEAFYPEIALRKAYGKPLSDIVRSINEALNSGKYTDTTGLAEMEEVNADEIKQHKVYHGSGSMFDAFDHSHMGEGEGYQTFGYGTYVTEVPGIAEGYAEKGARKKYNRLNQGYGGKEIFYKGQKIDLQSINPLKLAYDVINNEGTVKKGIQFAERLVDFAEDPDMKKMWQDAVDILKDSKKSDFKARMADLTGQRYTYEVEIPEDNGENYLDYDLKPTEKQLHNINGELFKLKDMDPVKQMKISDMIRNANSIGNIIDILHQNIGGKATAKLLHDAGYVGTKYPTNYMAGGNRKGTKNYVIYDEGDAKIVGTTKFFKTRDGYAYGFTYDGRIYIDPNIATSETPIHEYTHLWAEMMRETDPDEWYNIKKVLNDDPAVQPFIDKVKQQYPELTKQGREDDFYEEVLTQYSGKTGAEKLRNVADEIAKENKGVFGKAQAVVALQKMRNILTKFWQGVAKMMGWKYTKAEDIADKVLYDLLSGVNPNEVKAKAGVEANTGNTSIKPQMVDNAEDVEKNKQQSKFENIFDHAKRVFEAWQEKQDAARPEPTPRSVAQRIYEDAVRDTGEAMMIPALLRAIGNKEARERFKHKFSESWFDYSRSIKALQNAIEKAAGRKLESFEEVWMALNAKSSVDSEEKQTVMNKLIEPLSEYVGNMVLGKKIEGHKMTMDDVEKYLNAVHGIERNEQMALKQAQDEYEEDTALLKQQLNNGQLSGKERKTIEFELLKKEARFNGIKNYMDNPEIAKWWNQWQHSLERKHNIGSLSDEEYTKIKNDMETEYQTGWKLKYREKDYSGLTSLFADKFKEDEEVTEDLLEQAARDYAKEFEKIVGEETAKGLWDRVSALNQWSLRKSYESGLISKQQYEDTKRMYKHYVPLRGWHDDYAGDIYQFISRGEPAEVLQGVLKKAYGRKSRAARIFGTMAAMANTAIVQGNKNIVAQNFLNMALNHSDSDLLMVNEQYYQKDADGNLIPLFPKLNDNMSADEMRDEIERFEEQMKQKEDQGEVQTLKKKFSKVFPMHMAKWQERQHAVRVLRNGKEYMVYVLGNPRAAQAFNGLLNPHSLPGMVSDLISKYMRFLAKMQTSLSPEFLVSNFQRDVTTAATGAYVKYGKDYQKDFLKNVTDLMPLTKAMLKKAKGEDAKNWGGIFSLLRKYDNGTLDMNDETERYFKEFVQSGGMTGISHITKAEEYQASMEEIVKRMRQGKVGKVKNAWDAIGNMVEFANKGIENATRFATYMTSRQRGKNIRDSIFDAKEASVNFNMKGSGAWGNMFARRNYLYVNPAMQALRMIGTWYENDPEVALKNGTKMVTKEVSKRFMKAAAMTLAASTTLAMLNIILGSLLHGDDGDDDKDKGIADKTDWWSLSEWNRYNYINIINPFGKGYFHWSIPQELRPVWALGQIAVDLSFGRITPQRGLQSMLLQLNNLSPLSFFEGGTDTGESIAESELRTMTPTFVQPAFDALLWNRDFMGHPITNRGSFNEDDPEWKRAGKNTPEAFIKASRKINELTGGRTNDRGWLEEDYIDGLNNPSAVYYMLTQQFGGIGSMAKRAFNLYDQAVDPEQDVELRNMPFIPKFYVSTGDDYSKERVMNDKFWMYWNEYKKADHELSKDRSDVKNNEMSQAEADKTIKERKADGSYDRWKMIEDNNFDYLFKQVRGTELESRVKQMVVDMMETGKAPDWQSMLDSREEKDNFKLWMHALDNQREAHAEDLTTSEAMKEFGEANEYMRPYLAKKISKDAGASKDTYGGKPKSDHAYQYQLQRTADDVWEDAVLFALQEQLAEAEKEREKEELSNEREKVHYPGGTRNDLFKLQGKPRDKAIMDAIRKSRKQLLEKYGLDKKQPPKDDSQKQ